MKHLAPRLHVPALEPMPGSASCPPPSALPGLTVQTHTHSRDQGWEGKKKVRGLREFTGGCAGVREASGKRGMRLDPCPRHPFEHRPQVPPQSWRQRQVPWVLGWLRGSRCLCSPGLLVWAVSRGLWLSLSLGTCADPPPLVNSSHRSPCKLCCGSVSPMSQPSSSAEQTSPS